MQKTKAATAANLLEVEVRECGLLVLWNLVGEAPMAEAVWGNAEAREAILQAAQLEDAPVGTLGVRRGCVWGGLLQAFSARGRVDPAVLAIPPRAARAH